MEQIISILIPMNIGKKCCYKWILNTLTFLVDIIIGPPCNAKVKFQRIKTLSFVWNEMEYYNKNQNQKNQKNIKKKEK